MLFMINFTSAYSQVTYSCKWRQEETKEFCTHKFTHNDIGRFFSHLFNHFSELGKKRCCWHNCKSQLNSLTKKHFMAHINKLNPHTRLKKEEPTSFTCKWQIVDSPQGTFCGQKFNTEDEFYAHSNTHSYFGLEKMLICKWILNEELDCCNVIFSDRQGFVEHIGTHTKQYRFTCTNCAKRFITHGAHILHVRKCTGKEGQRKHNRKKTIIPSPKPEEEEEEDSSKSQSITAEVFLDTQEEEEPQDDLSYQDLLLNNLTEEDLDKLCATHPDVIVV